jgi:hypothetical protein
MDIVRGEDLAQRYGELIERAAGDERIILSHAGKQVAIVSFDDLTFLEDVDRELDRHDIEEVRRRLADPAQTPIPFVPTSLPQQPLQR